MVMVLDAQAAVTPAGKPVAVPMPVARTVVWVIAVSAVLIHNVGVEEAASATIFGVTVIVPVMVFVPPVQPPVIVTVYVNVPDTDGLPLIVTVFALHEPVTPVGKPDTVAPVAVVVV